MKTQNITFIVLNEALKTALIKAPIAATAAAVFTATPRATSYASTRMVNAR